MIFSLVSLLIALTSEAYSVGNPRENSSSLVKAVRYHETIGIPLARRIKEAEDEVFGETSLKRYGTGVIPPQDEHPYLAGLIIHFASHGGESACCATLVRANSLFTAAHCWRDSTTQAVRFTVVLGSEYLYRGGTRLSSSSVVAHPQWKPPMLDNDIAVIKLPRYVPLSPRIQAMSLPSTQQLWETFAGMTATAAGFGLTSDDDIFQLQEAQIRQVNAKIITFEECQRTYGMWVSRSHVCISGAGGVGMCGGDSGGPLFVSINGERILVGVASYSNKCDGGDPSAYTRITSYYAWFMPLLS